MSRSGYRYDDDPDYPKALWRGRVIVGNAKQARAEAVARPRRGTGRHAGTAADHRRGNYQAGVSHGVTSKEVRRG